MNYYEKAARVSQSPTKAGHAPASPNFDIRDLFSGPLGPQTGETLGLGLDEKLRKAYFWIVNRAIISPFYDIEYHNLPPREIRFGNSSRITLPTDQSYSSFVLLPLLTLMVQGKCLFVGGPGRGKTASAVLMGLLAGYSLKEIRRGIQHGQPQMTVSDLLGNPIPSDLMKSEDFESIRIAWRKWLGMKVKIIDEYNRIPTRTQSALLTVMADNYAELLDQVYECPESAWFLTANDDAGGGTYQVIEALRDRIDITVHAPHFNTRFIGDLLERIESDYRPEKAVPQEIIFTPGELEKIREAVRAQPLPAPLRRRLEFFAAQFEFMEGAGDRMEYKTKDHIKLSGEDFGLWADRESGKDKLKDLGYQTQNGLSVRSIFTCFHYMKALSYFRGAAEVELEDVRQVLPFVLHDKLVPYKESAAFEQEGAQVLRVDRVSWIRRLFDESCRQYDSAGLDQKDPSTDLALEFQQGLEGLSPGETKKRLARVEARLEELAARKKVYGPDFDEILHLKYLHQRYVNYLAWVEAQP